MLLLLTVAKLVVKRTQGTLSIYKITTSNRRLIKQVKRHKARADRFIDPLPNEIDNHADTTCFGNNFRVISFTSEVCSVSPYLSEYDSITDIPICTAATAVELESGETIILEFGQGLWFGDRLNHPLINPNQCRSYGINICDDPTDRHRYIGMELPDNYFLPFKMKGTTCFFESRSPDVEELRSCRTFKVPDANHWDPTEDIFVSTISSVERGHNSVYASDVCPVCVSHVSVPELHEVYLHEFDSGWSDADNSIDSNFRATSWGRCQTTLPEVGN